MGANIRIAPTIRCCVGSSTWRPVDTIHGSWDWPFSTQRIALHTFLFTTLLSGGLGVLVLILYLLPCNNSEVAALAPAYQAAPDKIYLVLADNEFDPKSRNMRVVLLSQVFERNMGYLENFLPKYLARLGVEVHVITTDLPPYYHIKDELKETYEGFADASNLVAGTIEEIQGFKLHVLPHKRVLGHMRMVGLAGKLRSIRPDIVQGTHVIGWTPLAAAVAKPFLGYKLFTANHYHAPSPTLEQGFIILEQGPP